MSGETGVQTASPRPNVVAEDAPEHPDDSDTETIVNQGPTVEEHAEVDLEVSQVENESKKTTSEEPTKLIEDEEMPTYTSFTEVEEKEPVNVISHEQLDRSDKRSVHSCETEIDSEDSSIESSRYYPDKMRKNCNYDDDSELYSDEDDDEKIYDDEDELEDEDKEEIKDENECADDDVQLVEDESADENVESPVDGERASSDDYERRQNNVTKTEIEGKKSHSYQDLSDPKLLSEPKKESSARKRFDANQVINPLKSASKSFKPGPKSYKQVQSKVRRYIENIKSISADERKKSEERKLKESQQNENQVSGQQQQSVQKSTAKMDVQDKQARFVQALQSEYIRANSEHDQRFNDLRPISIEKEEVRNDAEIKVPILNDLNSGITIKAVWPAPLVNRRDVEIILDKPDKEEKKVSVTLKALNGAAEQQDRMDYDDYMKPQDKNYQLIQELAQERNKTAALRKQLEALRWREHESKKIMRDMAVQTEAPRTSDTATSISDWSEFPSVSVPSLDNSTQTSNNLSGKLSNTFLTSSRILETFTAISTQLKNVDSTDTFTPNPKKRKLDGEEGKADEDMKCMVFKENENSAERSFLIAVQDPSNDVEKSDMQINRKCGPYLIGNLEIMMSEHNGTINVWGKEVNETNESSANTTAASNVTLENTERRTLKARRTLNPRLVCSTEKKKSTHEHNRPAYRNSYACHSRQLECASPPRYYSHYNRCNCHSCRSSCHSHVPERRHCRCEHPRMPEDEPEYDYYDGQEPEMNRERDYCCPNEERATGGASNAWNRMADTTLCNGKIDSGVHSDTLSNHDEEQDYLQNLGFHEMNKMKKRRPAAKSFINLLKSCGSDIRQTWSNRRNIPGHMPTSTSTSDFVHDANRSVYMPNDQDHRFKFDKNRTRPSEETKTAKNLYPEPQGN